MKTSTLLVVAIVLLVTLVYGKEPEGASPHNYNPSEALGKEVLEHPRILVSSNYIRIVGETNISKMVRGEWTFTSVFIYTFSEIGELMWIGSGTEVTTPTETYVVTAGHMCTTNENLYFFQTIPSQRTSGRDKELRAVNKVRYPVESSLDIIVMIPGKAQPISGIGHVSTLGTNTVYYYPNHPNIFGKHIVSIRTKQAHPLIKEMRDSIDQFIPNLSVEWECSPGQSGEGFLGVNNELLFVLSGKAYDMNGNFHVSYLAPLKIK